MNHSSKSYFELSKTSLLQHLIYYAIALSGIVLVFFILLPILREFFEVFMQGTVYYDGEKLPYSLNSSQLLKETSLLTSWAIDTNIGTPEEARFWFRPMLALSVPAIVIGFGIAVILNSILPLKLGLLRQKIEREIVALIDKIGVIKYGYFNEDDKIEIMNQIKNSDLFALHEISFELGISVEDLKTLQKALKWIESPIWLRLLKFNNGLGMYMRFYFTIKFANAVLGLVYIGAAILIIIIGLRGLKFIPANQPSYVLFALGLEFTLLMTYAFTLMYSKRDDEIETDRSNAVNTSPDSLLLRSDFGDSRDVEKLLRVFINIDRNSLKNKNQ